MCTANCNRPEQAIIVCDCCGIHTFDIDVVETGSFGYSGYMCKPGVGCQRDTSPTVVSTYSSVG